MHKIMPAKKGNIVKIRRLFIICFEFKFSVTFKSSSLSFLFFKLEIFFILLNNKLALTMVYIMVVINIMVIMLNKFLSKAKLKKPINTENSAIIKAVSKTNVKNIESATTNPLNFLNAIEK